MKFTIKELMLAVIALAIFCALLGWMQSDEAKHAAVDQSYADETRLDMKAQSEQQKRDAKWDELNAQANTYTGHAGIK